MVDSARRELSTRAGVPEGSVEVVSVEEVEWGDTSLGCPQPGQMYAQVITPGYRIRLRASGVVYEYHTDQRGRVVFCPSASP